MSARRAVLYPNHYAWFVLLASLDVMVTTIMLSRGDGFEANPIANWALRQWGLYGLVVLKFSIVCLVACLCEAIGRRQHRSGRRLAEWAVALNCIPVAVGVIQLVLRISGRV